MFLIYGLLLILVGFCFNKTNDNCSSLTCSKPIIDGKLYELHFGHQEIRLHGVSDNSLYLYTLSVSDIVYICTHVHVLVSE